MKAAALLILANILYFLPSLILAWREKPYAGAYFIVNLLFGWVVLPWLYLMLVAIWPRSRD